MTIDEAIELLKNTDSHGLPSGYVGNYSEAIKMAIQALENHMDYDKGFKDGIKYAMEHTELE